jgi:hypothetical protein
MDGSEPKATNLWVGKFGLGGGGDVAGGGDGGNGCPGGPAHDGEAGNPGGADLAGSGGGGGAAGYIRIRNSDFHRGSNVTITPAPSLQ